MKGKGKGRGRLSTWAFHRLDWDALIKDKQFYLTEQDLKMMNDTELVEILRLLGIRADRGYGSSALRGMIKQLGKGLEVKASTPVDQMRDRLMAFYKRNKAIVDDQLAPYCEFQCYDHPDFLVLSCYLLNQEQLDR